MLILLVVLSLTMDGVVADDCGRPSCGGYRLLLSSAQVLSKSPTSVLIDSPFTVKVSPNLLSMIVFLDL